MAQLFPESRTLELPVFQSLKKSISSFSLNIELKGDEVQTKRVVVDSYERSTSKWYIPWTWGDTEMIKVYGNKEYVDLLELWKERIIVIRSQFSSLKSDAIHRIKEDKDKLIDNYLAFLEGEFSTKFAAILADLEQKKLKTKLSTKTPLPKQKLISMRFVLSSKSWKPSYSFNPLLAH